MANNSPPYSTSAPTFISTALNTQAASVSTQNNLNSNHIVYVKKKLGQKNQAPPGGPLKFIDHKMRYSRKFKFLLYMIFGHTYGLKMDLKAHGMKIEYMMVI